MKKALLIVLILIFAGILIMIFQPFAGDTEDSTSALTMLPFESDNGQFSQALIPGGISFPDDLGPHNDYQTEWWYYTGNLETAEGRPFGYQLTFFRRAIPSIDRKVGDSAVEQSAWRSDQFYMAHFTISDIEEDRFYANERFSRGGLRLAGAQAEPYKIWLDNWSVEQDGSDSILLSARTDEAALRLTLSQPFPPVLHGEDGLSQKGPEPGNASYYYSIVGQESIGEVTIGDRSYPVQGRSWKDHEFGTSALGPEAVGWDWFSLQLSDDSALMFFEIRRQDGTLEPFSSGTYIDPQGKATSLELGEWQVDVSDHWTSPTSGASYPSAWTISIPSQNIQLTGRPLMADQELNLSTTYWEGAVSFEGTVGGQPATATGYIEMTGYAEPFTGRF